MKTSDIVLSCRVRLARNISGYNFPHKLPQNDAFNIIADVQKALDMQNITCMKDISPEQRALLIEKHLASSELTASPLGALITDSSEKLAVMINEEDHLRIQGILPHLDLPGAYEICRSADEKISAALPYAYHSRYGYLTACPTNLGTGMRCSAMMHLAGLSLSGQLEPLLRNLAKLGIAVRGFYGEGSSAPGNIYQLSNQFTLGMQEEEIVTALTGIIQKLAQQETATRDALLHNSFNELSDRIGRSIGLCRYAVKMPFEEFMKHISNIKLGISLGLLPKLSMEDADKLIISSQKSSLGCPADCSAEEEQLARAKHLREALKEI